MPPSVIAYHVSAATPESLHVTLGACFECKKPESSVVARQMSAASSESRSHAAAPACSKEFKAIPRVQCVARTIASSCSVANLRIACVPVSIAAVMTNQNRNPTSGCRATANSLSPVGPHRACAVPASEPRR